MVGVITAVLAGSAAGLLAAVTAGHSTLAGFVTGGVAGVAIVVVLMEVQHSAWAGVRQHQYFGQERGGPGAG